MSPEVKAEGDNVFQGLIICHVPLQLHNIHFIIPNVLANIEKYKSLLVHSAENQTLFYSETTYIIVCLVKTYCSVFKLHTCINSTMVT